MTIIILSCIVFTGTPVNKKVPIKACLACVGKPSLKTLLETDQVDELDRRIMKELQGNFPLELNPYDIMAQRLGITTAQLWDRVQSLSKSGMIRRIGFSIDSRKIGYSSTLAAVRVPQERVKEASDMIAAYPQITHSYLREDSFNIWFTVIAKDQKSVSTILKEIQDQLGLVSEDVMDLPVEKLFKLDARFK